jgi:two-component system, NarL family, invasion response regulator UvrY
MVNKRVLIVDDHAVMRMGLRELLQDLQPGVQILEANDGDEMLDVLRKNAIDLVVLDIHLPNTDTIKLVELSTIRFPQTDILIFSMLSEQIYGRRLLKAGAKGFLSKNASIEEIRHGLGMALHSKRYLSPALLDLLMRNADEQQHSDPFSRLSQREFEIVHDLLSGATINTIAHRLNLKPSTVGTYKARIFEKLQVQTVFELKELATLYQFN